MIGLASVLTMLVAWKLMALYFNSGFIVPQPEETLLTVVKLLIDKNFLAVAGSTILRGVVGFAISAILGIATGIFAGISPRFDAFIAPMLITVRSVPIISLILLALIWFGSGLVPVFVAMLTMFPFMVTNVSDGVKNIDRKLIEMAKFYGVGGSSIIRELYIPAVMPFIISGASSAMGIGWRAIIIGEVLSQPRFGIGTDMHSAQTFLNVEEVIAWTVIAVLISYGFEKIIRWSEHKIVTWKL